MEDLVSMCERCCRKACNLRSAAEDSDEACHSGSSGGRARRYRKRGSPKSAARDAGAMDTDPSPVRLWESEGHSEGYRTAYEPPSEPEMSAPIARAHTAPEPALKHDPEGVERPARARTAPVPRHTGPKTDAIGDTAMGDESEVPGTAGCAESGGKHAACHCEHVSFLMGKYPKMGMDAIVHRLCRLDNAKDGLEEDVAGILDDQSAAEKDMEELRAERDRYRENLELALEKQQRVVDSLLHLVEDMSGRLKRLEELQPLASGPELPAKPAVVELVERVKTLRSAMEKPMGGPAGAPYAPPRVDPGALPFVPMFSESTMLGEHTAPAGSMREGHVTRDPRSLTVQMSHAAQDVPITCDVRACDSGRLTHEIRPQTVPSISFRLDFHFFCPLYVFLKNSRYSDASVAYRRVPKFFSCYLRVFLVLMAPTQPKSRPSSDATSRSSGGLKKKTHGSSIKAPDPRNTILGKLDPSRISVQIDVDSASTASISSIPLPFPPQSAQSDPSGQSKHDGSQKKINR